jgi:hypothetical protein
MVDSLLMMLSNDGELTVSRMTPGGFRFPSLYPQGWFDPDGAAAMEFPSILAQWWLVAA